MIITKEDIRAALSKHKRKIISEEEHPGFRKAAVLITLFPKEGELHVLLTVRTDEVETHKGQISCPGGMCNTEDVDATATALRETEEEIGIPPSIIEILGSIDDHATPTGFIVTPVVGYLTIKPELRISKAEVADVFGVPLSVFIERKNARTETMTRDGKKHLVWYFDYGERTIWGATARMLVNFADVVAGGKDKEQK